ncbi:MAG TPA: (2Fe-2S)-binding protein [Woeseiaceae bacterium]|nr:(2Fe-2S)-binding protein [Woeseiaceae bacterium]
MAVEIKVNGKQHSLDVPDDKPLLWVLREDLGLTGTKFGCGIAQCGACSVHLDGQSTRSCVMPVSAVGDREVTTVEGVDGAAGMAVRSAWRELDVVQCGYCQSGQMMSATTLLSANSSPTDEEIDQAMRGNLCRCGTYVRIRAAIHRASETLRS